MRQVYDPHFTTGETGQRTNANHRGPHAIKWSLYLCSDLLPQSLALHHPASKGVRRGAGHRGRGHMLGPLQGWVTQTLNTGLHLSPGRGQ